MDADREHLANPLLVGSDLRSADAIVVLGGGVHANGTLSNGSLRRIIYGIELYRAGYAPSIILCSADPSRRSGQSEARAMRQEAERLGAPSSIFALEEKSRRTHEHAVELAKIAGGLRIHTILLVTNPAHMLRAELVFQQAGFAVRPAPIEVGEMAAVGLGRLGLAHQLLHEYAALVYYRARGWF